MRQFNMRLDKEFIDKVQREGPLWGIKSVAGFVRFAVSKFPFTDMERKWSDQDLVAFAKKWAARESKLGVLEDPAKQMERELREFKQDFLNLKS
jgi:hypothetical protein